MVNKNKDLCGYEKINFNKNDYQKIILERNVKDNYFNLLDAHQIDFKTKMEQNSLPIIIRENFILQDEILYEANPDIVKVCVLVHGLEGTPEDLRKMRSIAQYYCPDCIFILSEENEDDTWDNIERMGRKLANEVASFLKYYTTDDRLEISFIGFSLGGLIIRAGIPYLKDFKKYFKTLITINTPHIGSISSKFLVNTGMKFMTKFKKNKSLREMTLEDDEGYLIKLSKREGLEWFETFILMGTYNDGYAPFESCKMLYSFQRSSKSHFIEMAKNLYNRFKGKRIIKMGLYCPQTNKGFGYYLGRDAHVNVLDNTFLKHLIFYQLKEYI